MKKRIGVMAILVLAFFGLADSVYLAQHAISGTSLLCNIENLSGCNIVANSQYSRIFGIPLASYGVAFYAVLFVLAALELALFNKLLRRVLQIGAFIGVVASLVFVLIQMFLINAFCIYCFLSAAIAVLILVSASRIEPLKRRDRPEPSQHEDVLENEKDMLELQNGKTPGARNLRMPPL